MKKAFESGKLRAVLSTLMFAMTCGVLTYALSSGVNPIGAQFTEWNTSKISNQLTEDDWNQLMANLDYRMSNLVPQGAIMAFTTSCPNGWTRFSDADGRFLMGAQSYGGQGGSNSIMLTAPQLPAHQHYIRYGNSSHKYGDNANHRPVVVDRYTAQYPRNPENNSNDHGMSSSTSYSYTDVKTAPNGPGRGGTSYSPNVTETGQKTIDITNAYVKVVFCKKN